MRVKPVVVQRMDDDDFVIGIKEYMSSSVDWIMVNAGLDTGTI